jgi:hypothetical protein
LIEQQIAEYDLAEAAKGSRGLPIAFAKRIFQSALPRSMTRVCCGETSCERLLVADSEQKLRLFDSSTFELLATFLAPIYEASVERFVSSASGRRPHKASPPTQFVIGFSAFPFSAGSELIALRFSSA